MQFVETKLGDIKEELKVLLVDHYNELTLNKDVVKLNPIWEAYEAMEKAGRFVMYIARDDKLWGYSAWFVTPHMHYADLMVAVNDVLYLHKDQRKGSTGIKLIKFSESMLKQRGVNKIVWHIKKSNDWSSILYRMGYSDEEKIVGKIL